jgi:hypothetical protein
MEILTLDPRVSYCWNADQLSDTFRRMRIIGYEM